MANEKMTKREVLTIIVNGLRSGERENFTLIKEDGSTDYLTDDSLIVNFTNEDVENIIAYCENELGILDRKSEKAKNVQSKTQKENEGIKANSIVALEKANAPVTVSALIKEIFDMDDFDDEYTLSDF